MSPTLFTPIVQIAQLSSSRTSSLQRPKTIVRVNLFQFRNNIGSADTHVPQLTIAKVEPPELDWRNRFCRAIH